MNSPTYRLNPVAIGGVGGSGTRLVANILTKAGCYLGGDLNGAFDNLWFTVLLRRKSWFKQLPHDHHIRDAIKVFQLAMSTGLANGQLSVHQQAIFEQAIQDFDWPNNPEKQRLARAVDSLRHSQSADTETFLRWGWKEPNTHIFLPHLAETIPDLKYIHVIRNGLDMAFSTNQNQPLNWGKFILNANLGETISPISSLDYWIKANHRAIEIGRRKFGENFHLLSYDALCKSPDKTLPPLLDFLGMPTDPAPYIPLIAPKTLGRHKTEDLTIFSKEQKQAVHDLIQHL